MAQEIATNLDFQAALSLLKKGERLTRTGWNGQGLFVQAQFPDGHSKMRSPYLFMDATSVGGETNPWVPSQVDMFAEDWQVVQEESEDAA